MNSSFDATKEEADEWADAPPVIGWRAPAKTEAPTRVTSSTWTDGYDQPTPIQTHTPTPTPIQQTTKLETDEFYSDPNICARDLAKEARLFSAKHESGINFDAYASVSVKVDGANPPGPIDNFDDPLLHPLLRFNSKLAGYSTPTPVQRHAIAIVSAGRDLIASAQTGSGKTVAFLFPILSKNLFDGPSDIHTEEYESRDRVSIPVTLILAPTRELAIQIHEEVVKFTYRSWIKSVVCFGGQPIDIQTRKLARGCDILVATPGRLVDLIERGSVDVKNIRYLVLDEADRMLDMGFGYQVRRILGEEDMHERRQTLLFSATFPANLQNITMLYMSNYLFLTIGRINAANTNITQQIICVDSLNDKKSHLLDLLATKYPLENQPPSTHFLLTLIFVRSKNVADEIANYLLDNNYDANSIHGGRDQQERTAALDAFKKGISPILVATDIASRGLDVPNVGLVVNFDLPRDSVDDYVHRIGRTGRAGNVGLAVSFYVPGRESEALRVGLCKCLTESGQEVPPFIR
ncbi:DEAD-domain-containing protein [Rhizoclosmatium globosum]|uniref:RNA helicase n=1 Tax=Rhizoclosmatium globosum TaxID=329046 RepID=A0A1Y2CPM3_9FUNG|nr:DEAD-domain-containing protein [Rhizoclosmatium globosum]|eukprot:ORY48999.1 DEAD-domain-containing protein [Rhizoclosmatium globosum]